MSETLKQRKDMDPEYEWDLSTLYKDDEEWNKAFQALDSKIEAITAYKGKLNNANTIKEYFEKNSELESMVEDVFCYASLRHSEDTADSVAQSMYSRSYGKFVGAIQAKAFANPEILSLDEATLESLKNSEELKDYKFILENLIREKAHTLSADQEELLAGFGEALSTGRQAASALMDADLSYDSVKDGEGQDHEVSDANFILLQTSLDRTLRENAFHSFYKGYKSHINTFAATYSGCVKGAVAEAKARNYSSSRAMSMSSDNIPESVYDNLVETVHKHMPAMYRYLELRKRLLGVDELHYYDVYAPLFQGSTKQYTYEEAQQLVLNAVKPLGDHYNELVKGAFKDHWIDVYPNKGKSGGAYSSGTYDSNPYILTNFTGTLDSVSTIAHEMGHSIHSWHTNHTQPFHYAGYSLFVAEVASTVNENLLIEQLLKNCEDPQERLVLLNQYLENFKGTVYRQTMFAEFEKEAHAMAERGESLDPESLSALYEKLIKEYFGEGLVLDEEVRYEWARIPHFYNPFYVYVYATGYSSAVALSEGILNQGEPAVKKYLEFLSMGSSAYPLDELKHAGVDLMTPEPIDTALTKFEHVLEDAEETAKKLGL